MTNQASRVAARWASAEHAHSVALMKFLSTVAKRLGVAEHVYVVGGAVRNFIINEPIKDVDIVVDSVGLKGKDSDWFAQQLVRDIPTMTNLTTNQYGVAILSIKGSWILDGQDMKGEQIEIANARKESYGGAGGQGYKPHMVEPANIHEDVTRREFTFNTLLWRLLDLTHGPEHAEVIDLTGCGIQDLANKELRCPRDPDVVFSDDPTRLLRVIKFVSKYGFKIPPDVAQAIKRNAPSMKNAPWEAIGKLLVENILNGPQARASLKLMQNLGLLEVVSEMVAESKPFQTYLEGQLRNHNVELLFDLLDLGVQFKSSLDFLTKPQQERFRQITTVLPQDKVPSLLAILKAPPIDNNALIKQFDIQPKSRSILSVVAAKVREHILDDPNLAWSPNKIQALAETEAQTLLR